MIEIAVAGLKHLADQVVFTGGATVTLYIDDKGAPEHRPTYDVDCVIELTQIGFHKFEEELNRLGSTYSAEKEEPICRWILNNVKIDFIPTEGNILGFFNKWHKKGVEVAVDYKISEHRSIKIFPVAVFIASKIEAFKHRGNNDYRTSHDIEDVIAVLNGNSNILESIASSDKDVKDYLKSNFSQIMASPYFSEIIYAHLPSNDKGRANHIENIIKKVVSI